MKIRKNRSSLWMALYLAPLVIFFVAFFVYPLAFNLYTSLMMRGSFAASSTRVSA